MLVVMPRNAEIIPAIARGILLALCLFTGGAVTASFPEVVGKYVCTARESRFLFGELGRDPRPPVPPHDPNDQIYYVEIGPVTVADLISADCPYVASSVADLLRGPMAPGSSPLIAAPSFERIEGQSEFGWRCLSALKMDRRSLGKFPTPTEYRTFDSSFLEVSDKVGSTFFTQRGVNGWFLMRSDLSFVTEDTSWNGGVSFEKGTCSRIAK